MTENTQPAAEADAKPAKGKKPRYAAYCRQREKFLDGTFATRAEAREAARSVADLRRVEIREVK